METPKNIVSKTVGADTVLLNTTDGTYYLLNPTGALSWELARDGLSAAEIAARLSERFDVPVSAAQRDVEKLLGEFRQEGLLI